MGNIFCYDPTDNDPLSKVRGVGRYLQILRENFPEWNYVDKFEIRNSKFEIFINPFFNFLQPPLNLKRIAKKQIAVIHDLIPLKYPKHFPVGFKGKLNIFLNKLVLKNYNLIVTDSEASKKDIVQILGIEENRVKVIYPTLPKICSLDSRFRGNDNATMKQFNNIAIHSQFCLYVGDATWNKNLVNLAKAIKLINVTCVFVGKVFNLTMEPSHDLVKQFNNKAIDDKLLNHPWGREFKQFLKEVNNDKRFIFLGYVSDEQLIQLYRRANCNVLVSRDEGFGFSYLEAASQGCPSVLADIPVLHEVSNNQGVLFAKPHDANNIANTMGEVYFNQDLKIKKGEEAQTRSKYFSAKKFSDGFKFLTQL